VGNPAGKLSDRIHLLRLSQLALDFDRLRNVVIDHHGANHCTSGVSQRPPIGHEVHDFGRHRPANNDLDIVDAFAARGADHRNLVLG
jgi:hypothetical protein